MATKAIATAPGKPTLRVPLTAQEEAARTADEAQLAVSAQAKNDAIALKDQNRVDAQARAMTKLGLSQSDFDDLEASLEQH